MNKIKKFTPLNSAKGNLTGARGFTLIEILVVIGIIAILAAVVLIAINPARQFAQARNSQRISNVNTIINAIGQRMADNKGKFDGVGIDGKTCNILPQSAVAVPNPINSGNAPAAASQIGTGGFDLTCLTPTYVPALPFDPSNGTLANSGYWVVQDQTTGGRVTIYAPSTELQTDYLSITR